MSEQISAEEYNEIIKAERSGRRRKYNNTKVEYDGRTFDSIKESERYKELRLMEQAGEIADLECQTKYPLLGLDGTKVAEYWSDFTYYDKAEGAIVIEDTKSEATRKDRTYRLKAKLFRAQYGVSIREV